MDLMWVSADLISARISSSIREMKRVSLDFLLRRDLIMSSKERWKRVSIKDGEAIGEVGLDGRGRWVYGLWRRHHDDDDDDDDEDGSSRRRRRRRRRKRRGLATEENMSCLVWGF
ncbi:hypothetical protein M5689_011399 [Euphorbia peplus]|nr:hypothetical protein M5689_011399 [Euphorbia peplus]